MKKTRKPTPDEAIEQLLSAPRGLTSAALARRLRISRQMAHRLLAREASAGRLSALGEGKARRYLPGVPRLTFRLEGLEEDAVLDELERAAPFVAALPDAARSVARFVFTEVVNNAIDHSRGTRVVVSAERLADGARFTVEDDGIGAFTELQRQRGLASPLEALQDLVKGKVTTAPAKHTGEGLFFSSKAVGRFELRANGLVWLVDNVRGEPAVGQAPSRPGTFVAFDVPVAPKQTLKELFDSFSTEYVVTRTQVHVKLFEHGVEFVSRSEAKRLMAGLERYRDVVLDFAGVQSIGQGFADEVFRVWQRGHPETRVTAINANPAVEFFVGRAVAEAGP
ncbi:MAG: DUF4325 domain-containing protein [Deltaproteobacteria bacterium]|nr:DUF4325 domain-containing protein [Deltaproteobacteria bacterium]